MGEYFVGFYCKRGGIVEIVSEPVVSELSVFQQRNQKKKKALATEFKKRKSRNNTGGVHGTKLITSYREDALFVLNSLAELGGEASTKQIRELSGIKNATSILYNNYYGWFENVKKGTYKITEAGYAAFEEFEDTIRKLLIQNHE